MFPTEMLLVGLLGHTLHRMLGRKASTSKSVRSVARDPYYTVSQFDDALQTIGDLQVPHPTPGRGRPAPRRL